MGQENDIWRKEKDNKTKNKDNIPPNTESEAFSMGPIFAVMEKIKFLALFQPVFNGMLEV